MQNSSLEYPPRIKEMIKPDMWDGQSAKCLQLALPTVRSLVGRLKPWKTLKTWEPASLNLYLAELQVTGCRFNDWTPEILRQSQTFGASQKFSLLDLSPQEIGFWEPPSFTEFLARSFALGLEPCPIELGMALRIAYLNQPIDDWRSLAMSVKCSAESYTYFLQLGHDSLGFWLTGRGIAIDGRLSVSARFLFVRS